MTNRGTRVALVGNVYLAQPIRRLADERFRAVCELLRGSDVTLANLECAIPGPGDTPAFVAGTGWAATYMVGTPAMVDDLRFMGIDGVCSANNHVADFGEAGVLSTIEHLDRAGMPFAGIGPSLREASEPVYITTPGGLRVAYVAVCDWGPRGALGLDFPWPAGYLPSDEIGPFRSRPGVNLLRYSAVSYVTRAQFEDLRAISRDLGWDRDKVLRSHGFHRSHPLVGMTTNLDVEVDNDDELHFLGRRFAVRDEPGHATFASDDDLARILAHVAEARRQADIVCVSLHDQSHGEHVHGYVDALAHGAIDAGADVFFNNGGSLMGIELYKSKAIIYGIPSFCLQTEGVTHVPSSTMARFRLPPDSTAGEFLTAREDARLAAFAAAGDGAGRMLGSAGGSAIFTCTFDDDARLTEVAVQPVEPLGGTASFVRGGEPQVRLPRHRRGIPTLPRPGSPVARRVLDHITATSAPFGTRVDERDGAAVVSVDAAASLGTPER